MSEQTQKTTKAPDAVAGPTEFATSADGTRIAFDRTGSGPVIVLVDGAMCYREFGPSRPMAAELSDRFTVVAYDRRGRGESGDTLAYAPECEIDDLRAVPVERFRGIRIPTLVLVGGKAASDMTAAQTLVAATIPGAEHRVLDGQTHQVAASALGPAAVEFFAR